MKTDFQFLLISQDAGVLTIMMNRPEVFNAFNETMLDEMGEALEAAATDEAVRCVVVAGAGKAFGSGQDLRVFAQMHSHDEPLDVRPGLQQYHRLVHSIRAMPKPVIAAVHGVAAGASCNLALACDLRIASEDARFVQAFARIGLIPDAGGGFFLPQLVGVGKALELAMLAEEVSGAEAERIGLVNKCVPNEEFATTIQTLTQRLASGPTAAYGLIKTLVSTAADTDLQTTLNLEAELQQQAFQTEDHREGVAAFLQKRKPAYKGK